LIPLEGGPFIQLDETNAFNYPQGARQQWVPNTTDFLFNCSLGDTWGAVRLNCDGERVGEYPQAVYAVEPKGQIALGLNFKRMHRLGGYGYVGLVDKSKPSDWDSGLTKIDLSSGEVSRFVSLDEIIACGESSSADSSLHYVTHCVWSPNGQRVVFLHRFWLADGGFMTRVMAVNRDTSNLHVICQGAFSHFDWIDSESIIVWGSQSSPISNLRNLSGVIGAAVSPVLVVARKIKRLFFSSVSMSRNVSYLRIPVDGGEICAVFKDEINIDGHPMVNRNNKDFIITDTYPGEDGTRDLLLLNLARSDVTSLGKFLKLNTKPSVNHLDDAQFDMHPAVKRKFRSAEFAFTRSGLHCDLHPRWFEDFKSVAFDSIHEGTRQIYAIDLAGQLTTGGR
jgi:hypothetical protein